MRKIKIAQFIGRQLARLKIGQGYYAMGMYSISAIGILKIAFPQISIWLFLWFLVPIMFVGAFFLGYIMDESNVTTMDYHKSIEMTQRYLTILDHKNNDFRIMCLKIDAMRTNALRKNVPFDSKIIDSEYEKFLKKWNPPKEK